MGVVLVEVMIVEVVEVVIAVLDCAELALVLVVRPICTPRPTLFCAAKDNETQS